MSPPLNSPYGLRLRGGRAEDVRPLLPANVSRFAQRPQNSPHTSRSMSATALHIPLGIQYKISVRADLSGINKNATEYSANPDVSNTAFRVPASAGFFRAAKDSTGVASGTFLCSMI
jgi:hypothetical protein